MEQQTDNELLDYMKESNTVNQWNQRRAEVKKVRNQQWISTNLDCNGLIIKTLKKTAL